jgi:phage tail sheath gpL-like
MRVATSLVGNNMALASQPALEVVYTPIDDGTTMSAAAAALNASTSSTSTMVIATAAATTMTTTLSDIPADGVRVPDRSCVVSSVCKISRGLSM